jgi:hypothetical protein
VNLLELLGCVLASHAVLTVWFEGSLFARPRAWLEAGRERSWLAELLGCRLCLGFHVSVLVALIYLVPGLVFADPRPWQLPVWAMATAGAVDFVFGKREYQQS